MPSSMIFLRPAQLRASWMVLAFEPFSLIYWTTSSARLVGSFNLRQIRHVRYFCLSPITTTCENIGNTVLMTFSMSTGATFSPPAVIKSSFILPVIESEPFLLITPTSPECTKPLLSIVFLVSSSFLKQPMKQFRPLKQISPLPSASGLSIARVRPGKLLPASLRKSVVSQVSHACLSVTVWGPESQLIPQTFWRKMLILRKNCRVDSLIGAALKINYWHSSRPRFSLILLKTSFLATPHIKGRGFLPVSSAKVPSGAFYLAHVAIFFLTPVVCEAIIDIFSSIFSQTLGTHTKKVLRQKNRLRFCDLQEPDKVALQSTRVSEEQAKAEPDSNDQIDELSRHVTKGQHTDDSPLSGPFRQMELVVSSYRVSYPGVVVVADHDCLGGTCGAACVYEGAAVARLGQTHPILEFIRFAEGLVGFAAYLHELVPGEHTTCEVVVQVLRDFTLPHYKVFYPGHLFLDCNILFQVSHVLQDHDLALGVIGDILAGIRAISRVDADGQVVSKDRARKGNSPLHRVKTNNVERGVIGDAKRDEGLGENTTLLIILAISPGDPLVRGDLEVEGIMVGISLHGLPPELAHGVGLLGAQARFLDPDGQLHPVVGGPEEVALGAGRVEVLEDVGQALAGDVNILVVADLGQNIHRQYNYDLVIFISTQRLVPALPDYLPI